jgi:hypothetical protein
MTTKNDPPLFDEAMDAMPLETQFEVAFILDELSSSDRATIGLRAENEVLASMVALPDYASGVRPEWSEFVA